MTSRTLALPLLRLHWLCPAPQERVCLREGNMGRAGVFVDALVRPRTSASRGHSRWLSLIHGIKLADPRHEELTTKVTINAGKSHYSRDAKGTATREAAIWHAPDRSHR